MTSIAELELRIAGLEDERGVLRTLHAYGHAADLADPEAFAACFSRDGECAIVDRMGDPFVVSGRAALIALMEGFVAPPEAWNKHLLIEPVINVSGRTACATSYFAVLRDHLGVPVLWAFGRYFDELVKETDDVWRLRLRRVDIESVDASLPPLAQARRPAQ